MSSVVVFLVALPLCMGIATASNVPVAAGLISGIIGGLVVGTISGAPLQVSGPAAGLSVIIYKLVDDHGIEALGWVVLVGGIFQIVAGACRLGQWFRAVCPAVVQGMLAGIGVLIFASQFHVMVDDAPRWSGLANLASIPESVWRGLVPADSTTHHQAARIGILTIIVLAVWKLVIPKKLRFIPPALAAVVIAGASAYAQDLDIKFVELPDSIYQAISLPSAKSWAVLQSKGLTWLDILRLGISLGIVASAETLLSVVATDRIHQGPRAKYDRELFAQGVGNMLCGLVSALPITGVIVRSSANIDAGARTRWSAVMHGAWLLLLVSVFPHTLQLIPKCCLGAILVYTGYKLANPRSGLSLLRYGKSEFFIYMATLVMIVATDLLTGVLVGIGLSVVKLLYTFSHLVIHTEERGDKVHLRLEGAATFMRLPSLAKTLERVPRACELHVDIKGVDYIDHACLDLLMSWQQQHEDLGGKLFIDWGELHAKFLGRYNTTNGLKPLAQQKLERVGHH